MKFDHKASFFVLMMLSFILGFAQVDVERVEPPFWWVGMESSQLQLLIKGKNIADSDAKIRKKGVTIQQVTKGDNTDYLFLDLLIDGNTKPGRFDIVFSNGDEKNRFSYELKERASERHAFRGLTENDAIYLITPDRFSNGDTSNDNHNELTEKLNRDFHGGRHGGDLKGISSKIDYIKQLGATTIWLNPVLENNMPEYSYHGYAITDFYKVDARYGTNDQYKALADRVHKNGMKIIMDMVFNHCGLNHWWMSEKPFEDWIHTADTMMTTNFAISTVSDPYASNLDKEQMEKGWFVPVMPDLNHDNNFMADYLIQNSIWWIEYAGLDGIRMDTYPYNKKEFMAEWARRVKKEYPDFYIVGETWIDNEGLIAYWADKGANKDNEFNSRLDGLSDFPICYALQQAFKPGGNVRAVYDVLSLDFLYDHPTTNNTFADNHDMDRLFHILKEDLDKYKLAMTCLLTIRGIPQLYYGSEILMKGHGEHGVLREDFPGGWENDVRNAFTRVGRTDKENEAFDHISKLLNWRKTSDAIKNGTLKHFIPNDNLYVYSRKSDKESVMVLINNSEKEVDLKLNRYDEIIAGFSAGEDILTGKRYRKLNNVKIQPNSTQVIKLEKATVN